jgi:serine/threonine protein kinase
MSEPASAEPILLDERDTPSEYSVSKRSSTYIFAKTLPQDLGNGQDSIPLPDRIGPYLLEREIGRGGMGVVYQARDIRLNRTVALKVILGMEFADPARLLRFQDEALAIAHLQHPNIVQVFDIGTHEQLPYMALEYVESGSLFSKCRNKPQEPRYAANLVAALADGIQHAHEHGVLHRDLKPANILLRTPKEEGSSSRKSPSQHLCEIPIVTDFGLAKRIDSKEYFTQSGQAVGTPNYMAPEQASGQRAQVGVAADVYGLGAILYELLTGRPPFEGVTALETLLQVMTREPVAPRQMQPKLPVDLETICQKCLQKDPGKRYASAAALADDLRRFLRNDVILARPTNNLEKIARWCRRYPSIASLLAVIVTLLVSGIAISSFFAYEASSRSAQLTTEKEIVAQEKEKAYRNLQRARTIIREYLADVDDNSALKDQLSEPVKQKLLGKAVPVLKELLEENSNTAELLVEQAKAQWLLGKIHASMGEAKLAETAFRAAIQACEQQDQSQQALEQWGESCFSLGSLLRNQGSYQAALKEFERAIQLADLLSTRTQHDARPRLLVKTYLKLADLHMAQSDVAAASKAYNRAGALAQPEAYETRVNFLTDRIDVLLQRARVETKTNQIKEAESRCDEALLLAQERWTVTSAAELNHVKAQISYRLALIEAHRRQFPVAVKQINQAIEQAGHCIAHKPLAYSYQLTLAQAYRLRANIHQDMLNTEKAGPDLQKSREMLQSLASLNPTYQCRSENARALAEWGRYSFQMKQLSDAERFQKEAVQHYAELLPIMPGDTELRSFAADNLNALGNTILLDAKRVQEAMKIYTLAEKEYAALVQLTPLNLSYRMMQGGTCDNLGNCLVLLGNYPEAEAKYRTAMELLQPILEVRKDHFTTRDYLRIARKGMGSVCLMTGRFDEAIHWYEQALPLCSREQQKNEIHTFLTAARQKQKP